MEAFLNIVVAAVVMGTLVLGLGLKFFLNKDDEVKGSCSSRNEFLGDAGCNVCGRKDSTGCDGSPLTESEIEKQ